MILTFSVTKAGKQMVSVDGSRPMEQANGGCRTMFDLAKLVDGLSVSDEPIDGWNDGAGWNGAYVNPAVKGYGAIGLGRMELTFLDAIGFNHKAKKMYWSSGINLHKATAAELQTFFGKDKEAGMEYILGLYPKVQDNPEPKKKGTARKVVDEIPF